jgi:hypothetical protein
MWAWLTKLIGGWLPIGTKPFPEWAGKVIWAVGIFVACQFVISLFHKPDVTTVQGDQIIQAEQKDMMGVGCNMWRGYIRAGVKNK